MVRVGFGAVLVLIVVACAGRSMRDEEAGDSGGEDTGGSAGTGGSASGGRGGTASGGGGGAKEICELEPDPGSCEAAVPAYAYDPQTGLCLPFIYGGCDGNSNRFETAEECYSTCQGPLLGAAASCDGSLDCRPISTGCCGCTAASFETVVGVNREHVGIIGETKCAGVACDPCTVDPAFAYFGASCRENHCVAWDSRDSELTACTSDADCRLRFGLGCCEGCFGGADALLAVNASREKEWICPDLPEPCPVCPGGPSYPGFAFAGCVSGRCAVYLE